MAKAVNQNDLVDIIKAQVESLGDIMEVVFKAVDSKKLQMSGNVEKKMKEFQEKLDIVYGEKGILNIISKVKLDKVKPVGRRTRWRVKRAVKSIIKLTEQIIRMLPAKSVVKDLIQFNITVSMINASMFLLAKTFEIVRGIKTLFVKRKINSMRKVFKPLQKLIRRINRIHGTTRAMIKLAKLVILVNSLKNLVTTLIILAPLLIILTILSPVLILGFLALILVLKVLNIILRFMGKRIILQMILLGMLVMVLCVIAMALIVLGMLAIPLIQMLPQIGLFFLGLVVVLLMIAAVGWVMSFLTPMIKPFLIGVFVLVILIGALWLVGYMLQQIGEMELDDKKIKENIKKIMSCIFSIAQALFESSYEIVGGSESDGTLMKIFNAVIGFFAGFIGLLYSAILLVVAVVVVALIWLIAHMLSSIQDIDLKKDQIEANVKTVMDTVLGIVNMLFFGEMKRPKKAEEPWYKPVLDYGVGLGVAVIEVVGAILAIAYLAVMVVAMLLILALVGILKVIEQVELDPKKINEQVQNVFDCCRAALNACMGIGQKTELEKSDKTFVGSLIEFAVEQFGGIFKTIINIVEGILAIAYVAVMVIAMLLILALAGILRALQEIVIDPEAINATVRNVFDCCRAALNACMGIGQQTETEESDKSWLGSFISWMGETVGGIFETMVNIVLAILSIAYVAIMIVAMLLILALAGILRAIQEIVLDPGAINATVQNVFDCCRAALNACMGIGQDSDTEESNNSFLGDLMSWIGEAVGGIFETIISILQAVLAIAYVALMIVAMLLILTLAGILRVLQEIELDANTIRSNVETCITTCTYINELISGQNPQKAGGESSGFWETIMEWGASLVGNIGAIIGALMNIMFIALSIVNILLIVILFNELKLLNEVKLNDGTIKSNIKTVLTSATFVNDQLAAARARDKEKENSGLGGFFRSVFPGLAAIADTISNYVFLSAALSSIGMIMLLFKELKELNSVYLDSNRIKSNIRTVISTAEWLETELYNTTHYTSGKHSGEVKSVNTLGLDVFHNWLDKAYRPMINDIGDLYRLLSGLKSKTLSEEDKKSIEVNIQNIVDMASNITEYINNKDFNADKANRNISLFARLGRVIKTFNSISSKGVDNSKEMVSNCIEMLDRVDSMNFQKLDKATTMFVAFAELSKSIKGNFDGLANTINENIMPVLEETQELLKKLPAELQAAGEQMSQSISNAVSQLQVSINNNSYESTTPTETVVGESTTADNEAEIKFADKMEKLKNARDRWQYNSMQDILDVMTTYGVKTI